MDGFSPGCEQGIKRVQTRTSRKTPRGIPKLTSQGFNRNELFHSPFIIIMVEPELKPYEMALENAAWPSNECEMWEIMLHLDVQEGGNVGNHASPRYAGKRN